ncbi:MAG: sel1 repeat family protein [Synergistaceae bacterium]|nr:sel1 repeat family protein [Synergistaceae bacterium]
MPKDDTQAVYWYRKAAEGGNTYAQNNLGYMYEYGRGGLPKDDMQAVYWWRKAAEGGDPIAQYCLGYMYEYGKGVKRDLNEARKWYELTAKKGHKSAEEALERLNNK